MITEIQEMAIYYWPKLIAAIWFAVFNTFWAVKAGKRPKNIPVYLVINALLSSGFISIVAESVAYYLFYGLIGISPSVGYNMSLFIFWNMFFDCLFIILAGNTYSKYAKLPGFVGAAAYMEYVCVERLCMILSVSQVTYLLFFILAQLILFLLQRKYIKTIFSSTTVNWKRIFIYLVGLFYILDVIYGGYLIFPELKAGVMDLKNVLWLDTIALISCAFAVGYMRISFSEAEQIDRKLQYMHKLQHSQEDIIISLAEISEAKSGETGQHIRRVAEYSKLLAQKILHSEYEVETMRVAAMMHDLGKLMISQNILGKNGKLTDEEYDEVKEHSKYGWELLSNSKGDVMEMARVIALQHHERWDGMGYPAGLRGKQISIYAQIVSVTDVYDALTSKRSYKAAWEPEDARKEIIDQRGKQFSPVVVDAFIACYDEIEEIRIKYADNEI